MDEKTKRLQEQREREELVMELTIRRVEMLLLDKMGLAHIDFIADIGRSIREEAGLTD